MDHAGVDRAVALNIREAIAATSGSVNDTAKQAAIPYATFDRKLRVGSFTVAELFAIGRVFGRPIVSFLPEQDAA